MKNKVTSFSRFIKSDQTLIVFWFRRDLRLTDNHGLYQAQVNENSSILPIFIFDDNILEDLDRDDTRVEFIHRELAEMNKSLGELGKAMAIFRGDPLYVFEFLLSELNIKAVYANEDYEPYALSRDQKVKELLKAQQVDLLLFKDHVFFHKSEILKQDGTPYRVYTPYSRAWKARFRSEQFHQFQSERRIQQIVEKTIFGSHHFPELHEIGFSKGKFVIPERAISSDLISEYDRTRDFPALSGTSKLGIHLRFGTISIRALIQKAMSLNETYLNELIWREFYVTILYHFPHVCHQPFKRKYQEINWRENNTELERWKNGETGIPFVDAGMRELNTTGFMHNRLRMITASFLCKNLLINWQEGEQYFAKQLLDFELASNNGGWQWVAGTGTDAAPYFRVFNPVTQQKKFDPKGIYTRKWVPEIDGFEYPEQMVDLKFSRERCLKEYGKVKNKG